MQIIAGFAVLFSFREPSELNMIVPGKGIYIYFHW